MTYTCKQSIKAVTNNNNMNIFHQNNEFKNGCNCRNEKYCLLGRKCLSPIIVKMSMHWKCLLWISRKIHQKISSTTLPNYFSIKITRTTQNCQKNTGKLYAHNIIWVQGKHYSCLNKNLEIHIKETTYWTKDRS